MNKREIIGLAACLCAMGVISCSDNTIAGNGTRTGNPTIAGVLYQTDGKTPAGNAQVNLRRKNFLVATNGTAGMSKRTYDTATATTYADGRFAIDSVDIGTYVIECTDGNNNYALNDSVVIVDSDSTVTLPPDTLQPAGAIKGHIKLSEGGNPKYVFVLAFGIDRFAQCNEDGSFLFGNLSEGKYHLRVISSLSDYGVFDTAGVSVKSQGTTILDTIALLFGGVPAIKNIQIGYDTLTQIVNLLWGNVDTVVINDVNMFAGYAIYKKHLGIDTAFKMITPKPITDTFFLDSTCRQEETYAYRISVVKKDSTEGKLSAEATVRMKSYFSVDTMFGQVTYGPRGKREIQHSMVYHGYGVFYLLQYDGLRTTVNAFDTNFNFIRKFEYIHQSSNDSMRTIADIASCGQGSAFIADFDDSTDRIRSVFMFTENGDFMKRLPVFSNADGGVRGVGIEALLFTVDRMDRIIFVNHGKDSIYITDTSGIIFTQFKASDNGKEAVGFPDGAGKISFVTTDNQDNICVINFATGIQVFSSLGVLKRRIAVNEMNLRIPSGNEMVMSHSVEYYGKGAFLAGTAIDPLTGRIFALDPDGFFSIFSPEGELITQNVFSRIPSGNPCDIVILGKKIYVALSNGPSFPGTIVKFTNNLP